MAVLSATNHVKARLGEDPLARGRRWVIAASAAHALETLIALALVLELWMTPEQLGVAMLAISLFPILDALADLGLGNAVAQAGHDARKLSAIFWLHLAVSVLLFGFLGLFAGAVAMLHRAPVVATLLTAYGVKLVVQNASAIPEAQLRGEGRLRALSIVRLLADALAFAAMLAVAAAGQPLLAFVAGPLTRTLVRALGLQLLRPFRPRLDVEASDALALLRDGLASAGRRFLLAFYENVDVQVVGVLAGSAALGLYGAARALVLAPLGFLAEVNGQLAFPRFARLRSDTAALRASFLAVTRRTLGVLLPVVAFLMAAAPDLLALLGPRYVAAAPTVRLFGLVAVLRALAYVVPPQVDEAGGSRPILRVRALLAVVLPAALVAFALRVGPGHGASSFALAWTLVFSIAFAALLAPSLPMLRLSARAYLRHAIGPIAAAFAAGAVASAARAMALAAGVELGPRLLVAALALVVILFVARVPSSWARRAPGSFVPPEVVS